MTTTVAGRTDAGLGPLLALGAMTSYQLCAALSVPLFAEIGAGTATAIRLATAADAAAIAGIYAPYVSDTPVSFEEEPPDAEEMARRMAGDGSGMHPWLAAEDDGRVIGFASSSPFRTRPAYRWTVETGVLTRTSSPLASSWAMKSRRLR